MPAEEPPELAGRVPTWDAREYSDLLRTRGVENVFTPIGEADSGVWQRLGIAVKAIVVASLTLDDLAAWYLRYRWDTGLPESEYGDYEYLLMKIVTNGIYRGPAIAQSRLTPGKRLTAIEIALDYCPDEVAEDFADVVNEKLGTLRVGLRVVGTRFVPVEGDHAHEQLTARTLLLLSESRFERADVLYRKAFARALDNDHAGAITAATSAVETMLRIGLHTAGSQLGPLLNRAVSEGWIGVPAQQIALKLGSLRQASDAHDAGTNDPAVAWFAVNVSSAILIHLASMPTPAP